MLSLLLLSECSRVMWVWASEAFSCFHLRPPEEATSAVLLASASSGSAPSHSCDYFLSLLSSEVQANLSAAHIIHFIYYLFLCTSNSYQLFRTEYQDLRKITRWAKKKLDPILVLHLKYFKNTFYKPRANTSKYPKYRQVGQNVNSFISWWE